LWPRDFEGFIEADYYSESLHKRLLPQGSPPIWAKLHYALPDDVASKATAAGLLGAYQREPVTNGWHGGSIAPDPNGGLRWPNHAGSWHLELAADKRRLLTSADNPYFQSAIEKTFTSLCAGRERRIPAGGGRVLVQRRVLREAHACSITGSSACDAVLQSAEFGDRWSRHGSKERRGTFSAVSVPGRKRCRIFAFGNGHLAAISESQPSLAAVDPFRPVKLITLAGVYCEPRE
jgi:hypothetical protein